MLNLISFRTTISTVSAAGDAFSIEKLLEYNELVSCFGQMHKEFEQCNKKGAEKAKSFLGQIELTTEWNKRLKCCGTWKLRDCWMKAARQKCTKIQADMVYKLPDLIMPALVEECNEYTPESGKCTLPIFLIVTVIITMMFILMICCCSVIYCIRRLRRKKKYRRRALRQREIKSYQNGSAASNNKMNGTTHHHNHNDHHKLAKETTLDDIDSDELKTLTCNMDMKRNTTKVDDILIDSPV